MSFKQLYAHNLYELSENAKRKIAPSEKYVVLGEKKKNYRAPFSWIIGGLSYCLSPVVAFFKTAVDFKTRHILETELDNAKELLSGELKGKKELLQYISTNYSLDKYKSSTSKKLLITLKKSDSNESQRKIEIINFLNNPLAKGTTLQREICHFVNQWKRTKENTSKDTYEELTHPRRRNSASSRTG